jgi:uncharacterized membrane protein (UPF0182 family)
MRDMFRELVHELRRRQAQRSRAGAGRGQESREDTDMAAYRSGSGDDGDDGDRDLFGGWSGRRPRARRLDGGGEVPQLNIGRIWVILAVIVLVVLPLATALISMAIGLWTDAIWYQSVGYADVFWIRLSSQVGLFLAGALVAFVFLWLNLWACGRLVPGGATRRFSLDEFLDRLGAERLGGGPFGPRIQPTIRSAGDEIEISDMGRPAFWALVGLSALVALGLGTMLGSSWDTIQLFVHRVPFNQADPSFGRDAGFYVFELPLYRLLQSYAYVLLLVSVITVGLRYLVAAISGAPMPTRARVHFGTLVMLLLIVVAIGFQIDRYGLVYSNQSGIFQGVSYTDANARVLALNVMTIMAAFAGALFLAFCATRWWIPLILTIAIWAFAYVTVGWAYPQLTQRLAVEPNQQSQETPYIQDNINMTRQAFNLSGWSSSPYQVTTTVTQASLASEQATVQNLRLWDYHPLQPTLENLQLIRNYYSFADVDTDRYVFNDAATCAPNPAPCVRQVMLAGRELDASKVGALNNGNSSWVNQHLVYTHGIGLVMLPVNEVVINQQSQSAVPRLVVSDLPPISATGAPLVAQPRIYFGTEPSEYVIVGGGMKEFDYQPSSSEGEVLNTWTGTTGIKLDSTLTKLLFAARFGDLNLLISNQVSGGSQLLFRRSIQERVQEIAPFLRYDQDPYLVVTPAGRLVYILDAFTTSDAYPDANTYDPSTERSTNHLDGEPFNYIRNSVKVVMDAYDGTTTFYVADPSDPIINAWQGVFPGLFRPLSDMSSDLRAHLRYPESYFNAQTAMFERYHVTDPGTFYQGNDVWQVARDAGSSNKGIDWLPLEAYYVEMQVPGQTSPGAAQFLLLQPMVPNNRPNMIAWVAAHNDPDTYGQVQVFDFPGNSTIYGPHQMQALIAANKDISPSLTLWSTQGSTVTMGNLLVVPLLDSILYVEPVYVQSANNPLPVLQKVIVASPGQVVWGDTLEGALQQLLSGAGTIPSGSPSPSPTASPTPGPPATPGASIPVNATAQQLVALANQHYEAAQEALRNGDLGTYQQEMNTVGQILQQLGTLLGTPAPSGH